MIAPHLPAERPGGARSAEDLAGPAATLRMCPTLVAASTHPPATAVFVDSLREAETVDWSWSSVPRRAADGLPDRSHTRPKRPNVAQLLNFSGYPPANNSRVPPANNSRVLFPTRPG